MSAPHAASTGAARKARERKVRSTARHVRWLCDMRRAHDSHHTAPSCDPAPAACPGCVLLRSRLASLEEKVQGKGGEEGAKKAMMSDMQMQAQIADIQQQIEALAWMVSEGGDQPQAEVNTEAKYQAQVHSAA